tara:strand:+ start:1144 stop:1752 length:609 start_codon:yes stop_codon:yes gene_type:complete
MAIKAANDKSMSNITALPSGVSAKSLILITTTTASNQSNISFTSGIDSTYKEYVFKLFNCTANGSSSSTFQVNFSVDGGSNYNVTKTTTIFWASQYEDDSASAVSYRTASDLAQSTSYQPYTDNSLGAGADESLSGTLHLFDPSNTTFVKHFTSTANWLHDADISVNPHVAGYCNTTSAVNAVQFKMASGNIDGTIKMYGVV